MSKKFMDLTFNFNFKPLDEKDINCPKNLIYRPYNSEDEKMLLMQLNSMKDEKEISKDFVNFIDDFVKNCVVNNDNEEVVKLLPKMSYINKLWLFLLIRSKSKSNIVKKNIKCENMVEKSSKIENGDAYKTECGFDNEYKIDIENDIKLINDISGKQETLDLPKDGSKIDFVLTIPSFKALADIFEVKALLEKNIDGLNDESKKAYVEKVQKKSAEVIFAFIKRMVINHEGKNELYNEDDLADMGIDEFYRFTKSIPGGLNSITSILFSKLPSFVIDKTIKCKSCGQETNIKHEGIVDFF